jgi:O-methyltransferase
MLRRSRLRLRADDGIAKNYYALDTFSGFVREHLDYEASHRSKDRGVDLWFMNNKKEWFDHALGISGVQDVQSIECDAATFDFAGLGPTAFALVDVDLYLPMAAILPKLYQAMSPGGIILVDDCTPHACWDSALVAYTEFVAQQGITPQIEHGKTGIIRKL